MATLYRTYRPQRFADLVGQDHIAQTLQAALATGRVGHAYLFCGPRGTGKTTVARLLAKAVNCQQRSEIRDQKSEKNDTASARSPISDLRSLPEPCNTCQLCQDITDGRALDVIEIDAASNRGIDEMRELREKIRFAPTQAKYKVYIIDEVHMLTKEAFNALLKTLEEPPAHAIFILATTEQHKVPVTISSRCQVFTFKKARIEDLVSRLTTVARSEQLQLDETALQFLARLAGGSYRDALSLLDQVSSHQAGPLTVEAIQNLLGMASEDRLLQILEAIARHDAEGAVHELQNAESDGIDMEQLASQLLETGRALLHRKLGTSVAQLVMSEAEAPRWDALTTQLTEADLLKFLEDLVLAKQHMKQSVVPALPLEVFVVKQASRGSGHVTPEPREQMITLKPTRDQRLEIRDQKENTPSSDPVLEKRTLVEPTSASNNPTEETPEENLVGEQPTKITATDGAATWQTFLTKMRAIDPSIHALVTQAEFLGIEGDKLLVCVAYEFARERLMDRKRKALIDQFATEVFGAPLVVHCTVKQAAKTEVPRDESITLDPQIISAAAELFGAEG